MDQYVKCNDSRQLHQILHEVFEVSCEAHIFEKIQFASHISKLYLSLDPGDVKKEKWGADSNTKIQKPMNTLELQKVRQNAQKFCNKFGISYFEID